jgi:uncharacterized membrane protein
MKKIIKYFFEGLLFVSPLAVSLYIVYLLFIKIDRILHLPIPGLGFVTTIVVITFIGFLASNLFTKSIINYVDSIFNRLPFIKLIYSSVKDLVSAFVGDKKKFDKPVLVTVSKESDIKIIGFVTRETLESLGLSDQIAVYIPQSYNFAGNLVIVPKSQVKVITNDSSDVMALIVSGGISGK